MSGKFKYQGMAEILHLSARKEGDDEDRTLATDVKFLVKNIPLSDVLCFDEKIGEFLFIEGLAVRNSNIAPLTLLNTLKNYSLVIGGGFRNTGVDVKKITLAPKDGGVFNVQLTASFQPVSGEIALIADSLKDEVSIDIAPIDGELNLEGGNNAS